MNDISMQLAHIPPPSLLLTLYRVHQIVFAIVCVLSARLLEARSPGEVVAAYYAQVARDGLATCVDLIHPDDQAKLSQQVRPYVARFFAAGQTEALQALGFGTMSKAAFETANDRTVSQGFLRMMEKVYAEVLHLRQKARVEIVGTVTEGDLDYVIIRWRMQIMDKEIVKLAVAVTKRLDGEPMMLFPEDVAQTSLLLTAKMPGGGMPILTPQN